MSKTSHTKDDSNLVVCGHPLVQEKLAALRDKNTPHYDFRLLMEQIGSLMGYEALAAVRTRTTSVRTPLQETAATLVDQPIVFAAVLRAGLGMIPGLLQLAPRARVGHVGLYRDEKTLAPVRYYVRLPDDMAGSFVVLCDPMLATGGSAVEALRIVKDAGAERVVLLSLIASREGVRRVHEAHPDVVIHAAAVDPVLNDVGYILPGLGDAGDRIFGTTLAGRAEPSFECAAQ